MYDFSGQVVVITGGARGIGLATSEAFAGAGARVMIWDSSEEALAAARGHLEAHAELVGFRQVDVRDADEVQKAAGEVLRSHRKVDVLINNAGVNFGDQSATGISDRTWETILDTNLKGVVHAVRSLSPGMIRRGQGRIINTGSIQAESPVPSFSAYAASKAAVVNLTRAWARELGPQGITVNAVSPGFIDTPMNSSLSPEIRQAVIHRTPLRRMGRPSEIASVHLFLASEGASFINGAVIAVDGGMTI